MVVIHSQIGNPAPANSQAIAGVGTSTAGFVGPAGSGPVSGEPEELTSYAD